MSDTLHFERQMSDVEALLWSIEDHEPLLRSTILVVAVFAKGLTFARILDRVDRLSRALPRFRERVVTSAVPGVNPHWEPDRHFDLAYHLRRVAAPRPGRVEHLLRLTEPMASEAIDKARPPWQMLFVEGLTGGQSGLIVKLHHSRTDGLGTVKLGSVLFDLTPDASVPEASVPDAQWWPEPSAAGDAGAADDEPSKPSAFDRMVDDLSHEVLRGVSLIRQFAPLVAAGARQIMSGPEPGPQAQLLLELLRSAARVTVTGRAHSSLMRQRSLVSRLDVVEVSLDDARRQAKQAGGTINDVYVAAVTAGLEEYHRRHDCHIEGVRLGIPVSTRGEAGDEIMRNQVAPARILAPFGLVDRVERIQVLHELLTDARAEPALGIVEALAGAANRLPIIRSLITSTVGALDAGVSNVAGSPVPLYLGGAEVLQLLGFGPRAGAALNLTLVSHDGHLRVGVNADLAAIPDVDVLVGCLRQGFSQTVG